MQKLSPYKKGFLKVTAKVKKTERPNCDIDEVHTCIQRDIHLLAIDKSCVEFRSSWVSGSIILARLCPFACRCGEHTARA